MSLPVDVIALGAEHEAAIGLGSNLGAPLAILQAAWQDLHEHPELTPVALSAPFRSQPLGMDSRNWFVNAAALVRTHLDPRALLHLLHAIEARHGRVRDPDVYGYQDRTLDLDLLFYDDLIVESADLAIPHPHLEQRLFVLGPLAEIAADRLHPLRRKTIASLLADLQRNNRNQLLERISWELHPAFFSPKG